MKIVSTAACVLVALAACGKGSAPAPRSYTLHFTGDPKSPPGGVKITMSVPANWTQEVDKEGCPELRPPGWGYGIPPAVVMLPCNETKGEACVDKVVGYQFTKDELARAKVERAANGSRWVTLDQVVKGTPQRHARRFIPAASANGMIMCIMILSGDDRRYADDMRRICDSLVVEGSRAPHR